MHMRFLTILAVVLVALITGCRDSSRTSLNGRDTAAAPATAAPAPSAQTSAAPAADTAQTAATDMPASKPMSGHSGISGEIRQAPLTAGLPEDAQDYAYLPGATVIIEDMSEKQVATVTSDSNGRFYVELPSGWYYLGPEPFTDRIYPHPPVSQQVFVPVNGTAEVVFTYSTGVK